MTENFRFQVAEAERRKRLDEFLFDKITAVSRMHLRGLLAKDFCTVGGKIEKAGYRLKIGETVEIAVDLTTETSMTPENIPLEIVYEDEEIIVVNKTAGMLVHPTKGVKSGTLLNALSYHLNVVPKFAGQNESAKYSNFIRAGLIHRLDKQTSGLMVVSKNARAHTIIAKQLQNKQIEKKYFSVVEGIVEDDAGAINQPIYHNQEEKFWIISEKGKPSESRFRVIERRFDTTLLELEPVTGRTNQLRLHLAHIRHPVIGDAIYGGREFARLCLHAYRLCFWHPNGNRRLEFETELPTNFLS